MQYLKFSKMDDFSYAITCINNISKIQQIIDKQIWDIKKIGNTLFIKIKLEKPDTDEKTDIKTRSLKNINFNVMSTAENLFYDAKSTADIVLLNNLEMLGYQFIFSKDRDIFFRSRPELPPRSIFRKPNIT